MKIRNEVWMIKKDDSIVRKEDTAENGTLMVIYTAAVGFQTTILTATFVSLDRMGANLHLSYTSAPETTFPQMLASFYDKSDEGILVGLKFCGFNIANSGIQNRILRAIKYAWKHIGEFEQEEMLWSKI